LAQPTFQPASEVWLCSLNFPSFACRAAHYLLLTQKFRSSLMLRGLHCSRVVLSAQPSLQPSLARPQALSDPTHRPTDGPRGAHLRPAGAHRPAVSMADTSPPATPLACTPGHPVPRPHLKEDAPCANPRPRAPAQPRHRLLRPAAALQPSRRPLWRPPPLNKDRPTQGLSAAGELLFGFPSILSVLGVL
jgi:hypothetical protein